MIKNLLDDFLWNCGAHRNFSGDDCLGFDAGAGRFAVEVFEPDRKLKGGGLDEI